MGLVVFFRAANVGGHQTFRPGGLVRQLASFGAVNVGAAGTLYAARADDPAALERAIRRSVPFEPELMIRPSDEVVRLVDTAPFGARPSPAGVERYATVLAELPHPRPTLPVEEPPGTRWQLRVVRIVGPFALSVRRPAAGRPLYPNPVIERRLGVRATTRTWATIEKLVAIVRGADSV